VKASAYLQAWQQREHTRIVFQIGARRQLKDDQVTYEDDARYVADAYVFAIFADRDGVAANVLDAERWIFFVVSIERLIEKVRAAKSISEVRLRELTTPVSIGDLRERIDQTRARQVFAAPSFDSSVRGTEDVAERSPRPLKTYVVARRATGEHAIIVRAADAKEAQLLARSNSAIAALGTDVSATALSSVQVDTKLRAGAVDLR